MNNFNGALGIDIGALYCKFVFLDVSGRVAWSACLPHKGNLFATVRKGLDQCNAEGEISVGLTGALSEDIALAMGFKTLDSSRCQIAAVKSQMNGISQIMDIGGGSASLIFLDKNYKFQGHSGNSLCAAGTGSFLDEQAERLNIDYNNMNDFSTVIEPPTIATRCAVFAKSDLIHRQQQGFSRAAMWSGLCRGMTRTLLSTLLSGKPLDGLTAVIGGVALNAEVIRWLEEACPNQINVPSNPHLVTAHGAALLSRRHSNIVSFPLSFDRKEKNTIEYYNWPLSLKKSTYPSFAASLNYVDEHGNEIRQHDWPDTALADTYLGIDIGSVSTKAALLDSSNKILADIYRKTAGDPIEAVKKLLGGLDQFLKKQAAEINICGVGVTGSGRKMVGAVIGADAIINEISAHVAGACQIDPDIDTIFEIGGQDSKYMHVVNGSIRDAQMNFVCAAGTGSFVEEQAAKLGYRVDEVGSLVSGIVPPVASDRCTVFMEQDVGKLIRNGGSVPQALAAVMVSVVKNYLNKVVGNRYVSRKKLFFQGATARNQALVAAIERVLDVEVVVSQYCHVMGAYGVGILVRQMMKKTGSGTRFNGLDVARCQVNTYTETCSICQNDCTITFAQVEGKSRTESWGYMCGRDPSEKRLRKNPHARLLHERERLWRTTGKGVDLPDHAPVIGIPQALSTYSYLPLWRRFFNFLGYKIQLSGPSSDEIRGLAGRVCSGEFCFPLKIAHGHIASLNMREGVDFLFVPQMVNEHSNPYTTNTTFCPYIQGVPTCTRAALSLNHMDTARMLVPVIDMKMPEKALAGKLAEELGKTLRCSQKKILEAWQEGMAAQRSFTAACLEAGKKAIAEAKDKNERLLLLAGRPYNIFDTGINLRLPHKIAEYGMTVLPLDFLDIDLSLLSGRYENTYWYYGQKILAALKMAACNENLEAIYLTNFGCGPDSFLMSFASEIMGDQPFLFLQLDEHNADTGYVTRIEAFYDVLNKSGSDSCHDKTLHKNSNPADDLKKRQILIPSIHPFCTRLFAAAFRRHGYDAQALPPEDQEAFENGLKVTNGSECLPTALIIGSFLKHLTHTPGLKANKKKALLIATAQGPCRLGQYANLYRQILDREGFHETAIIAPSSYNGYEGVHQELRKDLFKAVLVADILDKACYKTRPYEVNRNTTDKTVSQIQGRLIQTIEQGGDLCDAVKDAISCIAEIPVNRTGSRPLVGIVGENYVRHSPFANERLAATLERFGAEVWTTPMAEWFIYTFSYRNQKQMHKSIKSPSTIKTLLTWAWARYWEHKLYAAAGSMLADRHEPNLNNMLNQASEYMKVNIGGEAMLTIGRTIEFARQKTAMVVNCAPFSCMPGVITGALFQQLSNEFNLPIVNMFYDGHGSRNQRLKVFLENSALGDI